MSVRAEPAMTKSLKRWPGEPDGLWQRELPGAWHENRSVEERLAALEQEIILPYPYAASVESEILKLVARGRRKRFFVGAMIAGPRSNGRSTLAQQIVAGFDRGAWLMRMPTRAAFDDFWLALLDHAKPYNRYYTVHSAERQFLAHRALTSAKRAGLKLIIVDDCENLLEVPSARRRLMLHCVAAAWKRSDVPIVLVGTPKLASTILADYERVGLHEIFLLPQWRVDNDFLDLLEAWERALPLRRPSGLAQRELALHLYALCDGRLGMLASVLTKAAAAAITSAQEQVTMRLLDDLGFEVPSSFSGFVF